MEIPKMKLFIYVLTFAAYAWSGYGSSVLGNLRDAVLSAEGVFGDFLQKVTDVIKVIRRVRDTIDVTVEEDCLWSCPDGTKAKQNKYYKPKSNGCGPEGMEIDSEVLPFPDMTKCCNEHDICYGTCNRDKDKCDIDFKRCLYKICDKMKGFEETIITGCKTAAKLLYTSTSALGCKFYQEAQAASCFCPGSYKKRNEL